MLYVGNVIVNRVVADCGDFIDLRTVDDVIFHVQGGNYSFEAVQKGNMFYQRARETERKLARQTLESWRSHPAKYALWYFNPYAPCPPTWYDQPFPVNLWIIVFMNRLLERVKVFIWGKGYAFWCFFNKNWFDI